MGYLVFCDTDDSGNIIDVVAGINIIPNRQYDWFFYLQEPIDIMQYKVDMESRQLILK
ncbi:hypothetical protein P4482_09055 [Neobacillus thermocopriae]|uniref:hypothetical protein n=1 Tax=Neobacillus thermocopriae TaxID=1215031 RepID=UPI002E1B06FB|nr:hypothetical protein [Neobacillus thermocopriae]MED3714366.1 hypothetical protein [Neobacillus thermocopriae]